MLIGILAVPRTTTEGSLDVHHPFRFNRSFGEQLHKKVLAAL
jgi:hypothetical protein